MSKVGHNSDAQLKSLVGRIIQMEGNKREVVEYIKEIYAEAKSAGFDTAALRAVVKRALEDEDKREARETREELIEAYESALGDLADTPLGKAAIERASTSASA